MTNEIAIRVDQLSKMYRIGAIEQKPEGFWQTTKKIIGSPFQYVRTISRPPTEEETLWAIRNISFEVKRGEVVGIVGQNGAGKSTLLKILARITEPTGGRAEIRGRVGSLLEVGTGFHPELTGRENVYLNGAILGMRRVQIDRNFDEIVDFSGVGKFIDTPVKRYSSGMKVRLAFAVAAYLEPEILLIDEVLAVGDAAFQRKCLGKMEDVAKGGRTVLFVSHNMAAVESLCQWCVLLSDGQNVMQGPSSEVIRQYLGEIFSHAAAVPLRERHDRSGNGRLRITSFHLEDGEGEPVGVVQSGQDCSFVFGFECAPSSSGEADCRNVDVGIQVRNNQDNRLFTLYTSYTNTEFYSVPRRGFFRCQIPRLPLASGTYILGVRVKVGNDEADYIPFAADLEVELGDYYRSGKRGNPKAPILVEHIWSLVERRNGDQVLPTAVSFDDLDFEKSMNASEYV